MGPGRATTLDQLLDVDLGNDATTANGQSNHLPMALIALEGMGASDDRLEQFSAAYQDRLVAVRDPETLVEPPAIGTRLAYPELLARFRRSIEKAGADDVVERELPGLLDGVGGAAFHGLIRLRCGVRPGDQRPHLHRHRRATAPARHDTGRGEARRTQPL